MVAKTQLRKVLKSLHKKDQTARTRSDWRSIGRAVKPDAKPTGYAPYTRTRLYKRTATTKCTPTKPIVHMNKSQVERFFAWLDEEFDAEDEYL